MLYLTPTPNQANQYPVAILVKEAALIEAELVAYYQKPLADLGVPADSIIFIGLEYNEHNKAPVTLIKAHLKDVLTNCKTVGVKTLLVADGHYFKTLTKMRTSEPHHGYIKPCGIPSYEYLNVILSVNYQALFYNPVIKDKLTMSMETLANYNQGTHVDLGRDIIHSSQYPDTVASIKKTLLSLHKYEELTCDIETFGLSLDKAGIGSIGFAWDKHNGVSFLVDSAADEPNDVVRLLLREFFTVFDGKLTYHGGTFDTKHLIYSLFMDEYLDTKGLLKGLNILHNNIDDTLVMTYLATNTTAGNKLGLKHAAFEYTGNYAQEDIKDITKIPKDALLEYNLIDCLATWYVKEKHYPTMVADDQLDIYNELMIPSMKVITHMELNGMPMDKKAIDITWDKLSKVQNDLSQELHAIPLIKLFEVQQQKEAMLKENLQLKVKVKPLEDFTDLYNPGSGPQTRKLVYDYMGYPVTDFTKTKRPSTKGKVLKKIFNNIDATKEPVNKHILSLLIELAEVSTILSTFVKAFKDKTILKADGCYYLHGNFHIGGTLSGRLSSSDINLQNLPSTGSTYAKAVKQCFLAPEGWLMVGADFSSLEDKISALTTRDPNKLKVYTDGYDGHCLRAFSYFGGQMPDIVDTVESINSIQDKYPELRQDSKGPTFCLTYQGTFKALMGLGFPQPVSKQIESNYHKLYTVSDDWVQDKIINASKVGYTTVAFGLRLRTPVLHQCIINTRTTPYEAQKEGRTMGNAQGQSYGLLNNRSAIALHRKLLNSPYAEDIKPISHIHDAQYFIVRDDLDALKWLNDNLIKEMEWQELPELKDPVVKLGGQLGVFYPTWAEENKLTNYIGKQEIFDEVHLAITQRNAA